MWKTTECSVKPMLTYAVIACMMMTIYCFKRDLQLTKALSYFNHCSSGLKIVDTSFAKIFPVLISYIATSIQLRSYYNRAFDLLEFMPLHDCEDEFDGDSWESIIKDGRTSGINDLHLLMELVRQNPRTTNVSFKNLHLV